MVRDEIVGTTGGPVTFKLLTKLRPGIHATPNLESQLFGRESQDMLPHFSYISSGGHASWR